MNWKDGKKDISFAFIAQDSSYFYHVLSVSESEPEVLCSSRKKEKHTMITVLKKN
jgi:hypothetical protein